MFSMKATLCYLMKYKKETWFKSILKMKCRILNVLFQNTAVTNIETEWNTNEYRKETKVNWNT